MTTFASFEDSARALVTAGKHAELVTLVGDWVAWGAQTAAATPEVLWATMDSPLRAALRWVDAARLTLPDDHPVVALLRQALDAVPALAVALSSDRELPTQVLALCDESPARDGCLGALATNPKTPPSVLVALARDPAWLLAIAPNPALPPELVTTLARSSVASVRWEAARNPSLPVSMIDELATHADEQVRAAVVAHPLLSDEGRKRFLTDKKMRVRTAVVSRLASLPAELFDSQDEAVVMGLAANPRTPASKLAASFTRYDLRTAPDAAWRLLTVLAGNPSTPVALLEKLALAEWPVTRSAVASNPSAPVALLERLANDSVDLVRNAALANPSLPKPRLLELLAGFEPNRKKSLKLTDPNLRLDRRLSSRLLGSLVTRAPLAVAAHPHLILEDLVALNAAGKKPKTKGRKSKP